MDKIESYINQKSNWKKELQLLRSILLETELDEQVKWSIPVYSLKNANVAGIAAFKNYVGLWFYQGVFLKDKHKLLINAQEGKTKALRQMRFNSFDQIDAAMLKSYIEEAIENQKKGKVLKIDRTVTFEIPKELSTALNQNKSLKTHFEQLTKGKQKEYSNYIHEAKRDTTKRSRIKKITPLILKGIELHGQYK